MLGANTLIHSDMMHERGGFAFLSLLHCKAFRLSVVQ